MPKEKNKKKFVLKIKWTSSTSKGMILLIIILVFLLALVVLLPGSVLIKLFSG